MADYTIGQLPQISVGSISLGIKFEAEIATQSGGGVYITGSQAGILFATNAENLASLTNVASARAALGLSSLALQSSYTNFQPLDATLTGIASLAPQSMQSVYWPTITDAASAYAVSPFFVNSLAQTGGIASLGAFLGLGSLAFQNSYASFQPLDPTLTGLSSVTVGTLQSIYATGVDVFSAANVSSWTVNSAWAAGDNATMRGLLGLGSLALQNSYAAFQPLDATLTTIASITPTSGRAIYFPATDTASTYFVGSFTVNSFGGATDEANARLLLGLGSLATQNSYAAFQPLDATLTTIASLTPTAMTGIFFPATDTASTFGVSSYFVQSFGGLADNAGARAFLGLGSLALQNSYAAFQPLDATLTAVASTTPGTLQLIYFPGVDISSVANVSSFSVHSFFGITGDTQGRALLNAAGLTVDNNFTGKVQENFLGRVVFETTSLTLITSHTGTIIDLSATTSVTVTLPNSLLQGFNCIVLQSNSGQISFTAQSNATVMNVASQFKTSGIWAEVCVHVRINSGGADARYVLAGSTG